MNCNCTGGPNCCAMRTNYFVPYTRFEPQPPKPTSDSALGDLIRKIVREELKRASGQ